MIITPKIKQFICTNSHPTGCFENVKKQIAYVKQHKSFSGAKKALILGSSTGYGLASRIALAYGSGASTIGVAFDKEPSENRTGTAGWYNTAAFEQLAAADGLYAKSFNGDAFSHQLKSDVIETIKKDLGTVDIVIYSLASPVRIHPDTGVKHGSVIKPIGADFCSKTVNTDTREVYDVTITPATEEEVANTIAVMGGEDWKFWMDALDKAGALSPHCLTVAYSYIGPELTHPVYKNGTIGMAKKDLEQKARDITAALSKSGGRAFVSVNKALVTQASSAIPVVPLYISILYKLMKQNGTHEGCIEQMYRLCSEKLYNGQIVTDETGLIHIDDREMRPEVQAEILKIWDIVNTGNLDEVTDIEGYLREFRGLFGFDVDGVDYSLDVDHQVKIKSLEDKAAQ